MLIFARPRFFTILLLILVAAISASACQRPAAKPFRFEASEAESRLAEADVQVFNLAPTEGGNPGVKSYTNGNDIRALLMDREANLWTAGSGGITEWHFASRESRKFTIENGLLENSMTALAMTPEGQIWAGSQNGWVSTLEGERWRTLPEKPAETVSALAVGRDGSILVGTNRGVYRLAGSEWLPLEKDLGATNVNVNSMLVQSDGSLWVGAPGSVFHFDGEKWSRKRLDGLPTILAIAETPDQHVWFLHQNGLIEFDGNAWVDHPFWQRSAGRLFSPKSLQVDSKGILWIGASQGLYQLKDEGIEAVSLPHHGELLSFILDAEDHPWLGESYGGVYHDTGQGWDHLILAGEVASNYILTTAVDRDGSVWVGTDRGVSVLAGGAWATFTTEDGMVDDHILSIAVSEVTGIWFGTENGVSNYAGTRWRSYTVADGRTGGRVASIAALPDGSVWFVTRRGLSRFAGGQISLSPYSSLSGQEVRAVSAGPDGILWALTGESLSRFDGNRFFMVKLPNPGLTVALGVTKSGDVWVGSTRGGLSKLDRSLWDQFSVNNTDAASIGADGVVKLVSGGQERTLAGSYFRTYTVEDGLPSNAIRAIGISEEDTVWAATDQGVAVLTAEDRFAPSAIPGLAEAGVWSISVDPMGQAWLGATQGGLVRLEPTR